MSTKRPYHCHANKKLNYIVHTEIIVIAYNKTRKIHDPIVIAYNEVSVFNWLRGNYSFARIPTNFTERIHPS